MRSNWGDVITQRIGERRPSFIDLCSRIVQIPTENPPGVTDDLARFLSEVLSERGIEHQIHEPRQGNPLIVASIGHDRGPHLVLNAHLDVFPVEAPELWSRPPFSGEVAGGRIHGRGVADMKGGLTASLATFLLFSELADELGGRLSLTLVSDEETGGTWGAAWLLDNHPEFIGDALLNAEPTGLDSIWFGEKGLAWFRLVATGTAGHGSTGRGENAITRLAEALLAVRSIADIQGAIPDGLDEIFSAQAQREIFDGSTPAGTLFSQPSLNVGTIAGGIKANVTPHYAEAEVDVRIPFGVSPDQIYSEAERAIAESGIRDVAVQPIENQACDATAIPLDDPLLQLVRNHACNVVGQAPALSLCPGATDGRFWRSRGVSTVIFGPSPHGMAAPDEYIEIDDLIATTTVHALTVADYLGSGS